MSPEAVLPDMLHVVVELAVCEITFDGVVQSCAVQIHPFGAVTPVAPAMVMVTVHVPVVPERKVPADAPPTGALAEQPASVNVVPFDTSAGAVMGTVEVKAEEVRRVSQLAPSGKALM